MEIDSFGVGDGVGVIQAFIIKKVKKKQKDYLLEL